MGNISPKLSSEFDLWMLLCILVFAVHIRYLREDKPHGSAGGLYNFRDLIMEDNPVLVFAVVFVIIAKIMYYCTQTYL